MKLLVKIVVLYILFVKIVDAQWMPLNTSFGKEIRCMIRNGNALFVGTNEGGIYYSANSDGNWDQKNNGLSNLRVYSLAQKGSIIAAGTYGGGVYFTNDIGVTWVQKSSGITVPYIYALAFSGDNIIAGSGGAGIFLSTNEGDSWSNVLPTSFIANTFYVTDSTVLLGVGPYISRSTDNGANWFNVVASNSTIKSFALTSNTAGTNIYVGTLDGMFLSKNNGISWTAINSGLGYKNINALAVIGDVVFAATENGGVYFSTDNGTNWLEFNSGFSANTSVRALLADGNFLYAGTADGVVWKTIYSGAGTTEINELIKFPMDYQLSQNYPNPFNPNTKINFLLPGNEYVKLSIYNVLGQKISELVNDNLSAGTYSIDFNASNLSSGVYFYKLEAGSFTQMRKMLLIK